MLLTIFFLNCLKCVILCFGFFLIIIKGKATKSNLHLFVGAHERKCLCNDEYSPDLFFLNVIRQKKEIFVRWQLQRPT